MKVLVLAALVALALAASPKWERRQASRVSDSSFRSGREYRYAFDGQVATGLPQASEQHAATRLQADAVIRFQGQKTVLLQLQNVRFGAASRKIAEPREIQPFELFEEQEPSQEHKQKLELPCRFQYENGLVSQIVFDGEDNAWSENIKRSVLNILQVNLQKNERTDQQETRLLRRDEESSGQTADFFTAAELTLEGNCEVSYTVTEQQDRENRQPTLFVSKAINFDKCKERTDIRYNYRFGEQCSTCDKKYDEQKQSMEFSTVVAYNISGTPEQFLIRQAEVRSQYVLAPLNEKENVIATYVLAKLALLEASDNQNVQEPQGKKQPQPLLYNAEWDKQKEKFHMEGDRSFQQDTPYVGIKNKPEIVEKIVVQIVKEMTDEQQGLELETSHQFARLVKVLRMCNEQEIQQIHRQIYEKSQQDRVQQEQIQDILNNALAVAGTKNTIEHVVNKIQDGQISPLQGSQLLKSLVNIRTVSQKHIEIVQNLCKSPAAKRSPLLKQSCQLTLGALVNAICGEHKDQLAREEDEKLCPRELKQQYVQTLVQEYKKASTRYEKILALKTLANAGLDLSVFDLEKIIKDQNEEKAVRMQAIDALRQLRSVMPRKIQSILLPVFKNKWEHADVRMTAFAQVMQTLPERHILDQIAVQLQNERSQQVQAFVYNTFLSYANSTNPCEQQLAEDVQLSLRLVRVPQPETLGTSNFGKISGYSENLKAGWFLNGGAIFSNDSVLPKEVMASLDAVLGGQWNKYLVQIGASQQNLDQVLQKVLRKVQQEGFDQVVVRGKRSSSFQPTELLRGLVEKLSIKSRRQDSEDPHALLYIRYKDLDYAVIPIDEETISDSIKQAIRNGVFDLGNFERMLAQGYQFSTTVAAFFYETSRKIPTSLGLPLQINGKIPTVATIDGQVKVELQPKDSQKLNGVKLNIQAQPQIVSTHITEMECWSPIVNSGLKLLHSVQLNLPVDASIQVVVDKQLQIKAAFKAVETKKRVAVVQTRPVLFIRVWPKAARSTYSEPKEKTIYPEQFGKQTQEINGDFETVGVKVSVVGHLHQHPFTSVGGAPLPILAGNNHLEVFLQPGQDTPREYVFEAIVEPYAESVSKVEIQKNDFEQFYSKKTQRMYESSSQESQEEDFFDTESHEQEKTEKTSEQQRRQHYNRRVQNYESSKGYKHRINLKAKAVGSSTERRAEALIEATCNEEGHYCQLRIKAQRSPIQPETRQWTFEMNAQALYPEQPESFEQLKQQAHRELTGKVNAVWGDDKTSRVDIQIQGEQNREQKRWMRRVEGQQSGIEQHDALIEASFLNQYKIDIKYKLQPMSKIAINWCYQTLKARYYWSAEQKFAQNQEGQTQCIITIDPETRQYANVTIAMPHEQLTLKEIRVPMQVGPRARSQVKSNPTSLRQYVKGVAKNQGAECTAKTQKIETFDNVVYKAPLTTCYSVLAKDCATANPTFAVLMKKINKNAEEKKMKIIDENDVVEIEYNGEKFTTKVNGKKQEQKKIEIQNGQITKKGGVVVVDLEDVTVHFDGYTAKIQLSQLFQNQQCGLCGHYDGEQEDELRRADNELTDDLEDFHRSFLAQDEECDIEESVVSDKKNYKLYDSEEQNSEEDEDDWESEQPRRRQQNRQQGRQQQQEPSNSRRNQNGQRTKRPIETTRVIEYNHRVCFSKEPVAECPRKSHPEEQTEKKVKFACIERSHPEAQRLARLANKQVVDVDAYPDSFVEPIQVPTTCLAF